MVPAEEMIALWDSDDDGLVTKLIVIRQADQNSQTDKLPASSGACDAGWMEGNELDTPMGLFAYIATSYGFKDRETAARAVREFGKVQGAAVWAQSLLNRMGANPDENG